jgi:hypothetical protein
VSAIDSRQPQHGRQSGSPAATIACCHRGCANGETPCRRGWRRERQLFPNEDRLVQRGIKRFNSAKPSRYFTVDDRINDQPIDVAGGRALRQTNWSRDSHRPRSLEGRCYPPGSRSLTPPGQDHDFVVCLSEVALVTAQMRDQLRGPGWFLAHRITRSEPSRPQAENLLRCLVAVRRHRGFPRGW